MFPFTVFPSFFPAFVPRVSRAKCGAGKPLAVEHMQHTVCGHTATEHMIAMGSSKKRLSTPSPNQ